MKYFGWILAVTALFSVAAPAYAHKLCSSGETVDVAKSDVHVTPARDWNRLSGRPGKHAEVWTLDGEQLNDVTFFADVPPGEPLVKDRNKKRDPLPKFTKSTLLVEIPDLLEGTYRTYKNVASFDVLSIDPTRFLGCDGVIFTYRFVDDDQLTRKGEARAAIIDGKLYMITFDAPRLHYYDTVIGDFRQLADSAILK
ncbi:hypothetical protein GCM10011349_07660 [Novosphingobium indicum]|uniref:Uncharacterized protein n=1 Tax=Novosphingobium indicum TaxID=462949 RepID=A0ABQ2JA95_9SPHN|nr:hypothetical protein [Novosphingobium indicum]GGN43496.1 hypothetical protein GCM10011349_07660 [Novosphingobium indicum]